MNDYNLELILGLPITYQGVVFKAPTIAQIAEITPDLFEKWLTPFTLTPECFVNLNASVFIAILHEEGLLTDLLYALKLIINYSKFSLSSTGIDFTICNNDKSTTNFVIDERNFNTIAEIVLCMNARQKRKVEKPPVCRNESEMNAWKHLQAGRQRVASRDALHLYDVINICLYGGNYTMPIQEILKMTLWQLTNCYKSKHTLRICRMGIRYRGLGK